MTEPMARLKLARAASFWLLATLFAFFLFAAGAPSPLYVVYAAMWHFSSLTLTAIFGVYALALLAALLTTGRLSDHLGRRPVVLLALVVQIVSMVAFIAVYLAFSVPALIAGVAVTHYGLRDTTYGYSLREALSMAEKNGVDPKAVVDMLIQTLYSEMQHLSRKGVYVNFCNECGLLSRVRVSSTIVETTKTWRAKPCILVMILAVIK